MKIVLDTNCLLQAVPVKSDYHCILSAVKRGACKLCVSTEILLEYEELLLRYYSESFAKNVLGFIIHSPNTEKVNAYFNWNLIHSDPDDNKFVDCALNSGADFLVTNDRHFSILKQTYFPPVTVVDIDTFREILLEELE
jgi:putative PIN family toxin of toxin-antitoxin system